MSSPEEKSPLAVDEPKRFAFGQNWQEYSDRCLDDAAREEARQHLRWLAETYCARRGSFLDIGCGSGLFLLAAAEAGFTRIVGFDYDPDSVSASLSNWKSNSEMVGAGSEVAISRGDVLDTTFMSGLGEFDFVYAWGSLHHTGQMWNAIRNAASRVAVGGTLLIAIYNRTWSSPLWRQIKRLYVHSPRPIRSGLVGATYVVGLAAKAVYTRSNPFKTRRGMNYYHNIVDWVGGYPYEYASREEIVRFVEPLGFSEAAFIPGKTPIACNEFVFVRKDGAGA